MKKFLNLLFAGAVMIVLGVACDKDEPKPDPDPDPIEGVFTEYSLMETLSQWTNLDDIDAAQGEFLVINSDEQLRSYITGSDYPTVDFTKKTLLLTRGQTGRGIDEKTVDFQQRSTGRYQLSIEIVLNDAAVVEGWIAAILVDKLSEQSSVELNVTTRTEDPVEEDDQLAAFFSENLRWVAWALFSEESEYHDMRYQALKDTCVMINSAQEFEALDFSFLDAPLELPAVDFENHTLIIAKWVITSGLDYIVEKQMDVESDKIILNIRIDRQKDAFGHMAVLPNFFWELYPKLPQLPIYLVPNRV